MYSEDMSSRDLPMPIPDTLTREQYYERRADPDPTQPNNAEKASGIHLVNGTVGGADDGTEDKKWREKAACRVGEKIFFPAGEYEDKITRKRREAAAKKICAICVVKEQCLKDAFTNEEPFGIWGELTEEERFSISGGRGRYRRK